MRRVTSSARLICLVIATAVIGLNSCSKEDDTGTGPGGNLNTTLRIDAVILNPKSPSPGDTTLATVVVTSDTSLAGDFATFKWSSNGGTFVEDHLSTVRWVAPNTSNMFSLTVTASNSSSSATATEDLFVSQVSPVVGSGAGEMTLSPTGDSLYYYHSFIPPTSQAFSGFGVRALTQGGTRVLMPSRGSFLPTLSKDFSTVAYVGLVVLPGGFAIQVRYTDLNSGVETNIPYTSFAVRGPQYYAPDFSPDASLLAYQVWFPDQVDSGVDTFVVAIWDLDTKTEKRVAVSGGPATVSGLNFYPTFSTDGNHLVYLSNQSSAGSGDWELYSLPVVGGTVPVDTVQTPLQLTFSGGAMGRGQVPNQPLTAWSPVDPNLGVVDADGKLRLLSTDGSGDVLVNVPGVATELAWSPSGGDIMLTTGVEIYRVDNTGAPTLVHEAVSGDNISRMAWSSDEKLLMYSIKRFNDTWYEVLDLTGSLGFTTLRVTSSGGVGESLVYSQISSLAPAWMPSGHQVYMLFFDQGDTPSIWTMDLGGLIP